MNNDLTKGEMDKCEELPRYIISPKNRAMSKMAPMDRNAIKMMTTGCGIAIPDHLTSATIAHMTTQAIATQISSEISEAVEGTTARSRALMMPRYRTRQAFHA